MVFKCAVSDAMGEAKNPAMELSDLDEHEEDTEGEEEESFEEDDVDEEEEEEEDESDAPIIKKRPASAEQVAKHISVYALRVLVYICRVGLMVFCILWSLLFIV